MYEININSKMIKKCAFCRNWYDPTNSAINPKTPNLGIWQYDANVRKKRLLRNTNQKGGEFCSKFEIKL
ncbi:hypothetical protein [Clostridium beijerinckii]|uniref:hypothetical protein n=1 Tax=Clostridium beijerinckii TaxID=1520 RepID=UPI000378E2DD|nr:hypothetical protein [Clostridium beijerinckii]